MRNILTILGIVLIISGIGVLAFQGYSYTRQEQVLKIGEVEVTAEKKEHVHIPPMVGIVSIIAGIALVSVSFIKRQ